MCLVLWMYQELVSPGVSGSEKTDKVSALGLFLCIRIR